MQKEWVLYNYFRSSASYRVRIALNWKGIDYDYVPVHLVNDGGEQFKAEYSALNPSKEVPTLIHRDPALNEPVVIGQSMAIIQYLDQVVSKRPLFSSSATVRARQVQFCEVVNSGVQPLHNLRVLKRLETQFGASDVEREKWTQHFLHLGLESCERLLEKFGGRYSIGDEFSAADCFLAPHLANVTRFKLTLDGFPRLQAVAAELSRLDAVVSGAADRQIDSPKT